MERTRILEAIAGANPSAALLTRLEADCIDLDPDGRARVLRAIASANASPALLAHLEAIAAELEPQAQAQLLVGSPTPSLQPSCSQGSKRLQRGSTRGISPSQWWRLQTPIRVSANAFSLLLKALR